MVIRTMIRRNQSRSESFLLGLLIEMLSCGVNVNAERKAQRAADQHPVPSEYSCISAQETQRIHSDIKLHLSSQDVKMLFLVYAIRIKRDVFWCL
ncbi:uncharacterized [Tachysurus ichikawai]